MRSGSVTKWLTVFEVKKEIPANMASQSSLLPFLSTASGIPPAWQRLGGKCALQAPTRVLKNPFAAGSETTRSAKIPVFSQILTSG